MPALFTTSCPGTFRTPRNLWVATVLWAGIFLSLVFSVAAPSLEAQESPRGGGFAALVNGKPITFYDLEQALERKILSLRGRYPDDLIERERPKIREEVLGDLITERLLLNRCNREKIDIRPDEVDLFVQSEIDRNRASGDDSIDDVSDFFDQWEGNFGENEEQARQQIRNRLRIRRLLDSIYQPEYISPAELRAYYRNHPDEFATPTVRVFRQIILPRDDPDTKELLAAINAELEAGVAFEEVTKTYSRGPRAEEGGRYELADKALDSWYPPIPETVRATPVGMVTEPIFAGARIHIIEVEEHRIGRRQAFAECQLQIRSKLRFEREDLQRERFERELRRNAEIRTFLAGKSRN